MFAPRKATLAIAVALAAGCAVPPERPLTRDHPASVHSEESVVAPVSSTLDVTGADPIPAPEVDR